MSPVHRTFAVQRAAVATSLAGSAVLFWRGSYDVFNTPKATLVVLAMLVAVAAGAVRLARTRRLVLPLTPAWWALGVFAVGLLVATVAAGSPLRAVVGEPGRHTGTAMYLTYSVLLVVCLRVFRDHAPDVLVRTLVVTAVPVALYGLLQAAGVEVFAWRTFEAGPQVVSTLGNANFLAAWLGIVTTLGAGAALLPSWSAAWRITAAAVAVLAFGVAVATASLQGVASAGAGLALVAGVWVWHHPGRVRRLRGAVIAAAAAAAIAVLVAVYLGVGPLDGVRESAALSVSTRVEKWVTAVAMIADRPLTGFGFATFTDWFNLYRPVEVAAESGLLRSVDDPHDVPLALTTAGGVLLGIGYLAVVGVTAWALVHGLRRPDRRAELAMLGGGWVAYQAQSLVSIDVPPLAVINWVLAGAIIARATTPPLQEVLLPGAPAPARGRRGRQTAQLAPPSPALNLGIGALLVAAAWLVLTPLRADTAAADAAAAEARRDADAALSAYEEASATATWEGMYPAMQGGFLTRLERLEAARDAHREAARREPNYFVHHVNVARLSVALGDIDAAEEAYARALALDPKTPEVLAEVGEFELEHGDPTRARRLLELAVERRPGNTTWEQLLAQARAATDA